MKKNNNLNISVIIQARMDSERLPGKVLININQKPMLWQVINRLKFSKRINNIILAIPRDKKNDILEEFAKKNKLKYFRGSKKNVLKRYYDTAKEFKCSIIVRITSDCPLIDPKIVDQIIDKHIINKSDYTSNVIKRTFPRGLDVEVFNFKTLEKTYKEAKENHHKEHVTLYIRENPDKFLLSNFENNKDLSNIRLTVDEKEDMDLVRNIYSNLKNFKIFYLKDIIDNFNKFPQLLFINKNVKQKKEKNF